MSKKNDYSEFQDRIFQEIKELEDMESQPERERARIHEKWWKMHVDLGASYGLNEKQVRSLRKDGMNGVEFREAIRAAGKKQ